MKTKTEIEAPNFIKKSLLLISSSNSVFEYYGTTLTSFFRFDGARYSKLSASMIHSNMRNSISR